MPNTESLHIRNFAGLSDVQLELKPVTVLIGPQASGKSVCAKLAFFFKELVRRLPSYALGEGTKDDARQEDERVFLTYFPAETWGQGEFEVIYSFGKLRITARRSTPHSSKVAFEYSSYYDQLFDVVRSTLEQLELEDSRFFDIMGYRAVRQAVQKRIAADISPTLTNQAYFIPAGRSFFATLRESVFSRLFEFDRSPIDPFLREFGDMYAWVRRRYAALSEKSDHGAVGIRIEALLGGRYLREDEDDYILMTDGRRVPLDVSSSGQQEVLPLAIILATITETNGDRAQSTLFVEEPEAHLFPSAQRQIIHLFAAATDLESPESFTQFLVTTHSPYILAALNNLMYGGKIASEDQEKAGRVSDLLGRNVLIDPEKVAAYSLENGSARFIIDPETRLVEATLIDRVSGELAREFEQLVAIDFGGDAA
jgi:hypothetical protein